MVRLMLRNLDLGDVKIVTRNPNIVYLTRKRVFLDTEVPFIDDYGHLYLIRGDELAKRGHKKIPYDMEL